MLTIKHRLVASNNTSNKIQRRRETLKLFIAKYLIYKYVYEILIKTTGAINKVAKNKHFSDKITTKTQNATKLY